MKTLLLVTALAVAGSGCSTVSRWSDSNGTELTPAQLAKDKYACAQEAYSSTPGRSVGGSALMVGAVMMDDDQRLNMMFSMCMQARGYTLIK